jgi:antitoxin component YwqK of YwqJK toxin-antitoxin module
MNQIFLISAVAVISLTSCKHTNKVVEEKYPNGSPKRECVYKEKEGVREIVHETTFYPDKKVQMDGEYKDKKRDGKWIYYYNNGNVWSEGFFKNGKSDGKRVTHYENGKVFYEGYYDQDRRVGVWKFYDEKGVLVKTVDYSKALDKINKPAL